MENLTEEQLEKIKKIEDWIKELEEEIANSTNKENIKEYKEHIAFAKELIEGVKKTINESHILPEYRRNGYFNSKEFREIEEKVDSKLDKMDIKSSEEFLLMKKIILKKEYNLDWKREEERYFPGSKPVIVEYVDDWNRNHRNKK
jgi:hypothetical protein